VQWSPEFGRITSIPRRTLDSSLLEDMREIVTKPGAKMRLWDLQAQALLDGMVARGLFAPVPVGGGKTLICQLLPTVLDKKAVILTTPGLIEQARQLKSLYKVSFEIRSDLRYVSYSTLSSAETATVLEGLKPDLIIADEAHFLKDSSAARTKRFLRYMARRPDTLFCGLSGTITRRSIKDFGHLLKLALKDKSPLPRDWATLTTWAEALDAQPEGVQERPAGVLRLFCTSPQEPVRNGWRRRFLDTAGVVASGDDELESKLVIKCLDFQLSAELAEVMKRVEETWEAPGGEILTFALELSRVMRQVRMGGYYRWTWEAHVPQLDRERWKFLRAFYRRNLRTFLKDHAKEGLDSPLLVERAIGRGELAIEGWPEWKEVEEQVPAPETEWVWIDKSSVTFAAKWGREHKGSIVWTDVVVAGVEIAKELGAPYYGAGEESARGILEERGTRTIVASIKAHGVGRNLQPFSKALVAGGSPSGTQWEQLLGRLHRSGQMAKEVRFDVMFGEELDGALNDAKYIQELTGHSQKLLRGEII
jgi:hypothetical protein